ncbi:phosphotransferase family protein [Nocardioides humi]|uniref:Phosphotransferase family protein n=2 Tax=Nocardioides humi TaxID=449461 RepID=A0ABN2A427_9ACTN
MTTEVTDGDIVTDLEAVLRETLGLADASVSDLAPFGDGHSGETYSFVLASPAALSRLVLRLSPAGVPPRGPADVGRQGRIMAALQAAGAPAPRVLACSSEPRLAGRAFAVMELVEGRSWSDFRAGAGDAATAAAAVAALKVIQSVPLDRTSLSLADADGDPLAEVRRWEPLLVRAEEDLHRPGEALADRLAAGAGDAGAAAPVLVHGDFHYGNLMFGDDGVVAVLDWEIAGVGHPATDLACLAVASLRRRYAPDPNPTGSIEIPLGELGRTYGIGARELAWHVAASCYKYAAIVGYNLRLHRRGKKHDPIYESLQHTARALLDDGLTLLRDGIDSF